MKPFSDPTGAAPLQIADFEVIFQNVVLGALGFDAIALFILLIKGGLGLITAGSEGGKIEGAKKTVTYSILGIVVVISSFLLLRIIATFALTNPDDLLIFKIFKP